MVRRAGAPSESLLCPRRPLREEGRAGWSAMELPNYSQQLLQQLYALCREQQFCDCSVLVGTAHFRAHKLILAAASLLFRSALDGADTVSIDASLVAPDDFALLLEMIYTGKLPLGKHHFSKVISVADSLQMFDVAVSCKTLLRELLSCSSQDQGPLRDSSLPTANASGETTAPINQPQAAKLSNEVGAHSGQVSPSPAATTGDPARVQEQSLRSAVAGEKASDEERMLFAASQSQNSEVLTSSPSPGGQSVFEEGESTEPSGGEKDLIRGAGGSSKAASQDSLLCSEPVFSKVLSNIPAVLERLAECTEIEASLKEAILACCEGNSPWEAVENLIKTMVKEKTLKAESLMRLLGALEAPFPGLRLLLDQWEAAAGGGDGRGLLMEGGGEKSGAWQRKVTGASQAEVAGEGEQKARRSPGPSGGAASKKGLACRACRKSFHFFCRLKVHEKRCRVANQRQVQCQGCSETRASQRELEKHQGEAHRRPGSAAATKRQKKKQRRLPVACDICGREFAHASGMQYHKLTEHFDEKPFTCEECGAKFAANSTLRNHQRLHSGDRPFVCKHCLAAFSQASALAYHAKRKHAEGKMYACQYCTAVFAQSIELSRHVRTHTGDKPYVCRECGKGFRQANGLSIHLRTFHNIDDPYDCKKCQMSFPTLQEHQQHIHAAHSREYHPCPTCGKVFSAPSLLERHMVTHVGGKPFSCEVCNKAYQQLSGLWYHNRTHHPDIFAAQNHRSSKFSSLQCSSCDKTFSSTAAYRKHAKEDHAGVTFYECEKCKGLFPTLTLLQAHMKYRHSGSPPFHCLHCSASFHLQGALQNHVASEHTLQAERSLGCGLCGELFSEQEQLEEHCGTEHPKVVFADAKVPAAHIVQVIQAPEQVITLAESELTGSQVFLTLPDSQGHPSGRAELVTVTMEDLLNEKVTLICQEAK